MRRLRRSLLLSTASALALTQLAMSPANAAGLSHVQGAAGWLATQFVDATHLPAPDGDHFDSSFGPNYGENADAVFGLAAAKVGGSKGKLALEYLDTHLADYADTSGAFGGPFDGSIAKLAVAQIVVGEDPDDLLTMLKSDECPAKAKKCVPGSPASIFNSASDSFVILAEARADGTFAPSAAAVDYFLSLQCANGGFTDSPDACGSGAAAVDATSYGIMALQALGGHSAELAKAADWLASQRNAAGYWVAQGIPNTNSTGLAAAALSGAGRDVSTSRAWLLDQQVGAGHPGAGALRYAATFTPSTTSATSPSVLATAQGLLGLAGGSLANLTSSGWTGNANLLSAAASPSTRSPARGGTVTLHGVGYAAGERVIAELENAVVTRVGRGVADPSGVVDFTATLPVNAAPGDARLVVRGAASGATVSLRIRVLGGSGTSPPPSSSLPPLANTGADSSELLALGLASLLAGFGVLTVAHQRRRGRHAA